MSNRFFTAVFLCAFYLLAASTPAMAGEWTQIDDYKMKNREGYCNCVFAENEIEKGKEDKVDIKTSFKRGDSVYARCYLPGQIGKIKASEFWHELWIDGKMAKRTLFKKAPNRSWDQIQVWVSEDEYAREIKRLPKGNHEIHLWVIKKAYRGKGVDGKAQWVPVRLSMGKFTYKK